MISIIRSCLAESDFLVGFAILNSYVRSILRRHQGFHGFTNLPLVTDLLLPRVLERISSNGCSSVRALSPLEGSASHNELLASLSQ